jgi:hypothetical protein
LSSQQQKREPLLYIHQPEFQPPEGKMQESFSAKQAEKRKQQLLKQKKPQNTLADSEEKKPAKTKEVHEESVLESTTNKNKTPLSAEQVQKTIEEYDNTSSNDNQKRQHQGFSFRRVKPFREMDVNERLDYLANFPKQLPPVPCLFQTENKAMRGILMEKSTDQIVLKLFDKTEVAIPVEDIIEVRIIGL